MKHRLLSLLLALMLTLGCLSTLIGCDTPDIGDSDPSLPDGDTPTSDDPDDDRPQDVDPDHMCTDADADEKCDECPESVVVLIDFYVLNDLHGKFCDTDTQPGVDELATYLRRAYATDDHVVLVASGDMWQGSAESNLTGGAIITEWMNALEFVSMTLGNHEFDWGEQAIRDNLAVAEFPFLAINVYDVTTGQRADYCTPSVMVERGDIQIGIIGAIGDCYSSIAADMVENVTFKVGAELTALVKAEADRLRSAGADVIVYSLHDGNDSSHDGVQHASSASMGAYYDSSLSDGYVDVVFEAHSHQRYTMIDSAGTYHVQAGGENDGLSHVELKVNTLTGERTVTEAGVVKNSAYASLDDDEQTELLEDKYAETIDYAYGTLGRVDREIGSSELGDLMAQYYLDAALERWGEQYDIVLGGGYIKTRAPYSLSRGEATYADAVSLFPFTNRLVLCSVSGQKLLSKFIQSSNSAYHIALSEYGESIKDSISPNKTYYIVTDSYTSVYAPNGLCEIAEYESGVYARDLLAAAIRRGDFAVDHSDYEVISVEKALGIGQGLSKGAQTEQSYYVKGTVKAVENTTYGNLYLTDGMGNELYVYGVYGLDGDRYDAMSQRPVAGDEVVLYSPIVSYVNYKTGEGMIELKNAVLIETK